MTAGEISWERKLEEAKEYLGGLPSELVEDIGTVIGLPNHNEGTARSGCSDPFAIFSFLAFALAVANFLMDMNGNRRRRRSLDGCPAQDTHTENAVFFQLLIDQICLEQRRRRARMQQKIYM